MTKMLRSLYLMVIFTCLCTAMVFAQTVTVTPVATAYKTGYATSASVRSDGNMLVNFNGTGGTKRGWAVYNLASAIPTGATVTGVSLRFTISATANAADPTINIKGYVGDISTITNAATAYAACDGTVSTNYSTTTLFGGTTGTYTTALNAAGISFINTNRAAIVSLGWESLSNSGQTYTVTGYGGTTATVPMLTITYTCAGLSGVSASAPASVCDGSTLSLTGNATGATTYAWSGPSAYTSAIQSPAFTASATSAGIYTFTATNAASCYYKATTSSVSVNSAPAAITPAGSVSVCVGATTSLSDATVGGAWSISAGTGTASVSASGIVTGLTAGTVTASYTTSGCNPVTKAITVLPLTAVSVTATPNPVCTGASVSISGSASGASSYSWAGPNGFTSTLASPPAFTTTTLSAGVYTLSVVAGGCTSTGTGTLIVRTPPAAITGTSAMWPSTSVTLSNSVTGGTWSSSAPSIVSVNIATGVLTSGAGTGSAIITYSTGCGSAVTSTVSVFPSTPITGATTMCGINPTLVPLESWETGVPAAGSPVDGWTYSGTAGSWLQQLASTSANGDCDPAPAGTRVAEFNSYLIAAGGTASLISPSFSLVGSSGAYVTFSMFREPNNPGKFDSLSVYINTTAAVGGTLLGTVCRGSTLATSTVGAEAAGAGWYEYTFYFPASYAGATNYVIFTGTSKFGRNVYIDKVSVTNPATTSTLGNVTGGGAWLSSNPAVAAINSSTGDVTAIGTGTTTVSYTATYGTVTTVVTVNSVPTLASVSASPSSVCAGSTLTLTAGATTGTGGVVSYNWSGPDSYDDTTVASTTTYLPPSSASSGIYSLSVSYPGVGCTSPAKTSANITVNDPPSSINGSISLCPGGTTTLTSSPAGGVWASSNTAAATINAATGVVSAVAVGVTTISYTQACGTTTMPFYVILTPDTIGGITTICGTSTITILSESWESGVPTTAGVPVDGWSYVQGTGAANSYWLQGQASGSSSPTVATVPDGTKFANFNSFGVTANKSASLVSPSFSLSGISGASVSFYVYRDGSSYPTKYDSLSVLINTSMSVTGATYLGSVCRYYTLATGTIGAAPSAGWYQYTLNIPASYSGSTNYLIFRGTSKYGDNLYLDNIKVKYTPFTILTETTPGGTWSSSNTGVAVVNATGTVSSVSAGTANISYNTPCGSVGKTVAITTMPTVAGITPSATALCMGNVLTLSAGAVSGPGALVSYNWSGPGGYSTTGTVPSDFFTAVDTSSTGIYSLTVSYYGAGCTSSAVTTGIIAVNGAPTDIQGSTTICPATSTTLSAYPSGGTWAASNPAVATIDAATGMLYAVGLGTATVTYTQTCGTITTPIAVTSTPDPIVGITTLCFTSASFIPVEGWESGVPSVQGTEVDGWNYLKGTGNANNYWLQQAVPGGSNPALTTAPGGSKVAKFKSYNIAANGNSASLISPAFSLVGYNGAFVSFSMYRDNGFNTTADSISVYINTSMSMAGATRLGNICRATGLATPTAGTVPSNGWYQYTLDIPATFTGATNYVLFKGTSQYGNNMYLDAISVKYAPTTILSETTAGGTWSSSNGAVADVDANGKVVAEGLGTTTISYTTPCGYATTTVNVNTVPVVSSVSSSAATLCLGTPLTLTAGSLTGSPAAYNWYGPGGYSTTSGVNNVSFIPAATTASGVYTLSVIYSGVGCIAAPVVTPSVTVNSLPAVSAITPSATSLCTGTSLILTAGSVTGTGALSSYNWSGPSGYNTTSMAAIASLTPSTSGSGIYSLSVTYPGTGCTSIPVTSASVTVNALPVAYTVTGGHACSSSGLNVGLSNSESAAVSYELKRLPSTTVTALSGTLSALSFPTVNLPGTYSIVATGPGGCQSTMSGTDTVFQSPSIVVGTSPSVCQPTTTAALGYSLPVASPVTYNLDWNTAANSAGFVDVTGNPLGGFSIALDIPATGAIGNFTGSITVSNGLCTSAAYPAHVIVYATPVVPLVAVNAPCVNHAGSIDFTGVDSSSIDYTIDGGAVNTFSFTGTTHTLNTGAIAAPHTYIIANAHNPVCTIPINDTIVVNPIPMEWLGGTVGHESDWNEGGNWTCGFPPTVTDNASIGSTVYAPAIPTSVSVNVKDLNLYAPSIIMLNGGAVLNVKGNVTNTSTISGNGKVVLSGGTQQLLRGIGTISNLELDNALGARVDTSSRLMISNALTITSGVLSTNDSLELLSLDTAATARIAPLPTSTSIVGRVKTDQYVQGGFRRYRLWSHAFSDTMSLMQIQQFIDITGTGGTANGFVLTASNAPSAFRYNPLVGNASLPYDTGWIAISKINSSASDDNKLHPGQGLRLFVRGNKGEGLGYAGYYGMYTPSPSTIKMMGHVNQGPVSIRLAKGTTDPANQDYNLVGNPYPSPVDIGTIAANALSAGQISGSAFYLWIASTPGGGQWNIVPIGSPYYIGAHVGFEVRADHDGAMLNFVESDKAATVDNYLFKAPAEYTTLSVYDSNNEMWDMLRINFTDAATDNEDRKLDATKPMGTNFGFYSMSPDGHKLGIDARPYGAEKVIPLGVHSTYQQDFVIRANNIAVPKGGSVYLHDKLLEKVVEMKAGSEYKFTISKDKATQGEDRFELSMKPTVAATVKALNVNMTPNPATDDVKINFTSGKKEAVSVRVLDMSGVSIYSQDLGAQQNGTISVPLSSFGAGIYMVELTQGAQKVTQKLVKE